MSAQHTPGPWFATGGNVFAETDKFYPRPVAAVGVPLGKSDIRFGELEANAHLIAAAPALLEALVGMLSIINDSDGVSGYHLNGDIAVWGEFPEVDAARAAIAKATGQKGGA